MNLEAACWIHKIKLTKTDDGEAEPSYFRGNPGNSNVKEWWKQIVQ